MRIDKFLKNSRLIKRRTVSKSACDTGRILINDKEAKAGTKVKVGDKITIKFGNNEQVVEVKELLEHAPKDKAATMYEVIR